MTFFIFQSQSWFFYESYRCAPGASIRKRLASHTISWICVFIGFIAQLIMEGLKSFIRAKSSDETQSGLSFLGAANVDFFLCSLPLESWTRMLCYQNPSCNLIAKKRSYVINQSFFTFVCVYSIFIHEWDFLSWVVETQCSAIKKINSQSA